MIQLIKHEWKYITPVALLATIIGLILYYVAKTSAIDAFRMSMGLTIIGLILSIMRRWQEDYVRFEAIILADRQHRERSLEGLLSQAARLKEETESIAKEVAVVNTANVDRVDSTLAEIKDRIDQTLLTTKAAAAASKEAAQVANHVNDKIKDTNDRIESIAKKIQG